ncbi:MAG: MBL fold metallo-hydrolase [Flavobacteriia bacterium]|nr:MBL fold metallo-hydrolase [Flavobacteriia bacterium]
MSIEIKIFTFNPFQENMYILIDSDKNCVIIDPGCYEQYEKEELYNYIISNKLKPLALLNTHGHLDHVVGNAYVLRHFDINYYLHELDVPTMNWSPNAANMYGLPGFEPSPQPTIFLTHGEKLIFGNIELEVLFTPGHSPGHVVFYNSKNKFVINGDVLFSGSFGRFDLPGGNVSVLKKSITETMFNLPEETIVYCGHGPATTIGKEKYSNPILNY